jgi:hypothetical protein
MTLKSSDKLASALLHASTPQDEEYVNRLAPVVAQLAKEVRPTTVSSGQCRHPASLAFQRMLVCVCKSIGRSLSDWVAQLMSTTEAAATRPCCSSVDANSTSVLLALGTHTECFAPPKCFQVPDAKYDAKGLATFVAQLRQFMEDTMGRNVSADCDCQVLRLQHTAHPLPHLLHRKPADTST